MYEVTYKVRTANNNWIDRVIIANLEQAKDFSKTWHHIKETEGELANIKDFHIKRV